MALGGLRKAQLALHVKNKMLVCCLYLCCLLFHLLLLNSRAGFRLLVWVSQGEAHSRLCFISSSLLRLSALQGQRASLGGEALKTTPSQSPNILGTLSPSKASVGQEKGDRQIPGDKEELFAASALELVNVSCILSSSSGAWLTFFLKGSAAAEASQDSCLGRLCNFPAE